MGHHWLGRAAFVLSVAAMVNGIYIAAVGWGYYVAYGATLAMFLLLMALKDIIDIFMVSVVNVCHSLHPAVFSSLQGGSRAVGRRAGGGGGD